MNEVLPTITITELLDWGWTSRQAARAFCKANGIKVTRVGRDSVVLRHRVIEALDRQQHDGDSESSTNPFLRALEEDGGEA